MTTKAKAQYTSKPLTTIGAKRLLKLAEFLYDSMPRAKFNFATIMEVGDKPPLEALAAGNHKCGTVGCAIGWMPAVWPKVLKWDENDSVALRALPEETNFEAAAEFFGISYNDAAYLFSPNGCCHDANDDWVCHDVPSYATPKAVARHIRGFVKHNYHGKAKLSFV